MRMAQVFVQGVVTSALGLAIACSASPTSTTSGEPSKTGDVDPTIHRTVVYLNKDGTQTVREFDIPASQSAAESVERKQFLSGKISTVHTQAGETVGSTAQAISQVTCAYSDLWVFGGMGNTTCSSGTGDKEICFYGSGEAQLGSYCAQWVGINPPTCSQHWQCFVGSYWPTTTSGKIGGWSNSCCNNTCGGCSNCESEGYTPWSFNGVDPGCQTVPSAEYWTDYMTLN
jgi:hypothetical protein